MLSLSFLNEQIKPTNGELCVHAWPERWPITNIALGNTIEAFELHVAVISTFFALPVQ